MSNAQDMDLVELMAARLCHDLAGPVGAVANGVELLADEASAGDPEVTGLIAVSAQQAAQRLQWFRVAFGSGNSLPETALLAETRRIATALYGNSRTPLDWPAPDAAAEAAATRLAAKLVLNLTMVAAEALPRGGTVHIRTNGAPRHLAIAVAAAGAAVRMPDEFAVALRDGVAIGDVTAKAVPAYLAARLAATGQGKLTVRALAGDRLEFVAEMPGR